jgi:hypothetical protein
MGFIDSLADPNFKQLDDGNWAFYPWGVAARGYLIPTQQRYVEIRTWLKRSIKVSFALLILPVLSPYALVPLAVFVIWYVSSIRSLTEELQPTAQRQTLSERFDELKQIGLYFGPAILGSVVANGMYQVACRGRSFTVASGMLFGPLPLIVLFAIGSALLAWHEREPFGRLAWLTVAARQGYLAYAAAVGVVPNRVIAGTLLVAFAVLLTVSGARNTPRWFLVAGKAFVVVFMFVWAAQYYANGLAGTRSVVRSSPICRIRDVSSPAILRVLIDELSDFDNAMATIASTSAVDDKLTDKFALAQFGDDGIRAVRWAIPESDLKPECSCRRRP